MILGYDEKHFSDLIIPDIKDKIIMNKIKRYYGKR